MIPVILLCFALLSFGQSPDGQGRRQGQGQPPAGQQPTTATQTTGAATGGQTGQARPPQERPTPVPEEIPVITHHEITVGGKTLKYTSTVGMMPIKNRDGETDARIFFMAYTLDGVSDRHQRPLTFSFNGGAGPASVWLYLVRIGPGRLTADSRARKQQAPS